MPRNVKRLYSTSLHTLRWLCAIAVTIFSADPGLVAIARSIEAAETTASPITITFENADLTHAATGVDRVAGTVVLESAAPLNGSYSARIANVDAAYLEEEFSATDNVYVSFYLKVNALPVVDTPLAQLLQADAALGSVILRPDGALQLRADATDVGQATPPLTVGVVYRIGLHQGRGSGSDAVLQGYLAAGDNAFDAPFASTTSGTWTTPADKLRLGALINVTLDVSVDDLIVDFNTLPGPSLPTATPTATSTDTPTTTHTPTSLPLTLTPWPTNTQAPATATPIVPTATQVLPTATRVAPTATKTLMPPAATHTPTKTAMMPTPTLTRTRTATRTLTKVALTPTPTKIVTTATRTRTPTKAVATSTILPSTATLSGKPDRLTCTGYPEPRLFIEAQGWWLPSSSGDNFAHIHNGMCAPSGQKLKGRVQLEVRLIMHNTPDTLDHIRITGRFRNNNGDHEYQDLAYRDLNGAVCPITQNCEIWVPMDIDTSRMPYDGIQSIKIEVRSTNPHGRWMNTILYWRAYLNNGKSVRHDNSAVRYDVWASTLIQNFVYIRAGVDGTWPGVVDNQLNLQTIWHSADRYKTAVDPKEVRHDVILDANFHAGIPGSTLRSGRGEVRLPLSLDTRGLSDGPHKLIIRTQGDEAATKSTFMSVLVIPFRAQHANGTPMPTPTQPSIRPTPTRTLTRTPAASEANGLVNGNFENGTAGWSFFVSPGAGGAGSLLSSSSAYEGKSSGLVTISKMPSDKNVQLYQYSLRLEPNTKYRLAFAAMSNTGHDLWIQLIKHGSPYTNYGLRKTVVNLTNGWAEYRYEFTTANFSTSVSDGRLMFFLGDHAQAGDQFRIDRVSLARVQN